MNVIRMYAMFIEFGTILVILVCFLNPDVNRNIKWYRYHEKGESQKSRFL